MPVKKTTAKTASTRKKTTPRSTPTPKAAPKPVKKEFIRNLRGAEVRLRFPSQKIKDGDKGVHLNPRGQRGDIEKVPTSEDLESKYYFDNVDLLFEALSADEVKDVVSKQSTNEQARVHPAQAMLRNHLGEEMEGGVSLDTAYEDQGVVVGQVDLNQESNRVSITRGSGQAPIRATMPGTQDNAAAQAVDAVARQKGAEGPAAGGIRKVTIEDVKKG